MLLLRQLSNFFKVKHSVTEIVVICFQTFNNLVLTQFNIPRNWLENQILVNLKAYLWSMIKAEFLAEHSSALKYISSLQTRPKPKDDYSTLNQEHLDMAENVRSICKELGKPYFFEILLYHFPK